MAKTTKKAAKKSTKKVATKKSGNERGFGTFPVKPITLKNAKSADVKEFILRDFVLGAILANNEITNEELGILVKKAGRPNSQATIEWYAARVRQGHIKAAKMK